MNISYGAQDSTLVTRGLIGFSRETKRATDVLRCVVRDGAASRAYFNALAATRNAGRATTGDGMTFDGFSGTIWCSWNDEFGFSMTCGGEICDWTPWAQVRMPRKVEKATALANSSSGGGYWECGGNGCSIYQLLGGGFAYDCPGDSDPGSGGGGSGQPPSPSTLTCSQNVEFGQTGVCSLTVPGYSIGDDTVFWELQASSGAVTVVDSVNNTLTWSGPVVVGGTVTAIFRDSTGDWRMRAATLTVTPRQWTWGSTVTTGDGVAGEIDQCFPASVEFVGLTASRGCIDFDDAGWLLTPRVANIVSSGAVTLTEVSPNGPNRNVWYVESTTATMDLKAQLRKHYRSDGGMLAANSALRSSCGLPSGFMLTVQAANSCYSTATLFAFQDFQDDVWYHERQHLSFAYWGAIEPQGDFQARLTSLFRASSSDLTFAVRTVFQESNDHILQKSLSYHLFTSPRGPIEIWDQVPYQSANPTWTKVTKTYDR